MFFSEPQLLCSPEYLISLITYSRTVSDKQLIEIKTAINEKSIAITPQMEIDENNNAHIYIYGPLVSFPDPYLILYSRWETTYQSIQNDISQVYEKNPNKVFLHFDSPGGSAKGVDETWQAILDLREKFEVIAVNEGNLASGAYWLASAANRIVSTSETNMQGSIGVIAGYVDFSENDKKVGIKEKIFVSKNAKYKHFSQEGFDGKLQKQLDDLEEIFVARISEGRDLTTEEIYANFGQGSMLLSKAAKVVNMIDDIVPKSQLLFSDQDNSIAQTTIYGESNIMTLEEMLSDPGVLAEIARKTEKAMEQGRIEGKQEAFASVKSAMVYLDSDVYPTAVKDCALSVCEGITSKETLETLVSYIDQEKAAKAALLAAEDENNKKSLPGIKPEIGGASVTSVEDRVAAIKRLQGRG